MKFLLALTFACITCAAQSVPSTANDVKLSPDSPAINAGENLGPPYNLILDPTKDDAPFDLYDQSSGWMIGAFGSVPSFVISGTEISGVTTQ